MVPGENRNCVDILIGQKLFHIRRSVSKPKTLSNLRSFHPSCCRQPDPFQPAQSLHCRE